MIVITISKIVFILSVLGILFIVSRKIPALSQLTESRGPAGHFSLKAVIFWPIDSIKRLISGKFFQEIILGNLEKYLRRLKIMILKMDNIIAKILKV